VGRRAGGSHRPLDHRWPGGRLQRVPSGVRRGLRCTVLIYSGARRSDPTPTQAGYASTSP
jgi:hypothetical protein